MVECRHGELKTRWPTGRAGSNPAPGTPALNRADLRKRPILSPRVPPLGTPREHTRPPSCPMASAHPRGNKAGEATGYEDERPEPQPARRGDLISGRVPHRTTAPPSRTRVVGVAPRLLPLVAGPPLFSWSPARGVALWDAAPAPIRCVPGGRPSGTSVVRRARSVGIRPCARGRGRNSCRDCAEPWARTPAVAAMSGFGRILRTPPPWGPRVVSVRTATAAVSGRLVVLAMVPRPRETGRGTRMFGVRRHGRSGRAGTSRPTGAGAARTPPRAVRRQAAPSGVGCGR